MKSLLLAIIALTPQQYQAEFFQDRGHFVIHSSAMPGLIEFGEPGPEVETEEWNDFGAQSSDGFIGYCNPKKNSWKITLGRGYWDSADDDQRRALVYHELGHCVLNRPDDNQLLPDRPKSIMYPEIVDGPTYKAHWTEYLCELFRFPIPADAAGGPKECVK